MYIPILLGTAREGRRSEKAANFVLQEFEKVKEVQTEVMDVRDYRVAATDDSGDQEIAKKYIRKVTKAEGFIIVSPEYNHGYPGELKMMLDMAYKEYNKKPVAICGVAGGGMGGVRMVEQLRLICVEFQMVPTSKAVYFSNVRTLFDEQGKITDESYPERLKKLFEELLWYTRALKLAREP